MKLADLPQVRALTAQEKLLLMDELWQDIAHEMQASGVSPAEKQILDERWAAFLQNPGSVQTLDQFKVTVKKLRE